MKRVATTTSYEDWIEANAFASGDRSEVTDKEVENFLCTTPTNSSTLQHTAQDKATIDETHKFNTQSQFVDIETDVRSHFIEEEQFAEKDEEPLNTIDILDGLLKTTGAALQKENLNVSDDGAMELADPSSNIDYFQENKESQWELNNENGEPIQSFETLKSMLHGREGDTGGAARTKPVQDVVLPSLVSVIDENRNRIRKPVQNHLDVTIRRQKNILRREQKNLQRLRFMANTIKRNRKTARRRRQGSHMQKSTSLPSFEASSSIRGAALSSNIFRQLRKEGPRSYALRQSLRRQYCEQQRNLRRKTSVENYEGEKLRHASGRFDGFSSLAKYQSMKYEREREIYEFARRRRQQDTQPTLGSFNDRLEKDLDIFVPRSVEYNSSIERNTTANHEMNLKESGTAIENGYIRQIQRQINAERIIEAKHKRLALRKQILSDANNQVQDYARASAVKNRALSTLLHTSQLNNSWNRFEASFGRQLEENKVLLHDLNYVSGRFR